LSTIPNLGYYR